jgi:GNAT superfamily N-acetyltransferase
MNDEIKRLKLPRGVWQELIKKEIPVATQVECAYPDSASVRFQIFNECSLVANFTLSFLYGCKGVLVSHNMLVTPEYQGKGIAKKLQPIKAKVAQDLQVSLLLATVKDDNAAEKAVIKDWQHLETFTNVRTKSKIGIHIKKIKPVPPDEGFVDACGNDIAALVIDVPPPKKKAKKKVAPIQNNQDYSS